MIWLQFLGTALVIVLAGMRLARYGDVLGEKSGLGRSWIGLVLVAATTSLRMFTGFGATALAPLPNIAVGDVLGSCMFNLLILSLMDAVQPELLSAPRSPGPCPLYRVRSGAHRHRRPRSTGKLAIPGAGVDWSLSPALIVVYLVSMRVIFTHERQRRARETQEVAEELHYAAIPMRKAALHYVGAAVFVVGAALWLPQLGAELARQTGLGEAFVGSLFIAITTSLPEIVVSLAAVRHWRD